MRERTRRDGKTKAADCCSSVGRLKAGEREGGQVGGKVKARQAEHTPSDKIACPSVRPANSPSHILSARQTLGRPPLLLFGPPPCPSYHNTAAAAFKDTWLHRSPTDYASSIVNQARLSAAPASRPATRARTACHSFLVPPASSFPGG